MDHPVQQQNKSLSTATIHPKKIQISSICLKPAPLQFATKYSAQQSLQILFQQIDLLLCQYFHSLIFIYMDLESTSQHPYLHSPSPLLRKNSTPSTSSSHTTPLFPAWSAAHTVSEFSLEVEASELSRLMGSASLEEKENDRHTTDRFIPLRKHSTSETSQMFSYIQENQEQSLRGQEVREEKVTLDQMYRCVLLDKNTSKMFNFGANHKPQKAKDSLYDHQEPQFLKKGSLLIENRLQKRSSDPQYRKISKVPFKVLDAPNLQDDFYLNLLEWSSQNILSVALDSCLYFWNANNNRVTKFCDLNPESISSIHWNQQGSQISIGTSRGTIQIWDVTKNCRLSQYYGHNARVSSVAWCENLLASGSRDRTIQMRDTRQRSSRIINKYEAHTQQVCGLKWSFNSNLLASGGNDNKLYIWSPQSTTPICKFSNHCAAVKGIAWSPHNHGVLASGGGSADKTIKFWNTLDNTLLDSIDTGSQVCNLMFSKNTKEIVSTHGYSNNEIIVWKYPTLQKMTTLTGHSSRVLFLAMNPSGETIVTGAGDQTLRFWNVFPGKTQKKSRSNMLSTMELR